MDEGCSTFLPPTPRELVMVQVLQPPARGGVIYVLTGDPMRAYNLPPGGVCVLGRGAEAYDIQGAPKWTDPQNTWDQAFHIARDCFILGYNHVTLQVSAYHAYRAFLTVLKALQIHGLEGRVRLDCHVHPWLWHCHVPGGDHRTRLQLLDDEWRKVEEYRAKGHVATDLEALHYLHRWN